MESKKGGAPVPAAKNKKTSDRKNKIKKRMPIIGGVAAVLFIAALVLTIIISATSPQRRARNFVSEYLKIYTTGANSNKLLDLQFSGKMLRVEAQDAEMTVKEYREYSAQVMNELHDEIKQELGDHNVRFDVKIEKIEKVEKEDLKELKKGYREDYKVEIKAGKIVTLSVTVHADDKEETVSCEVEMIKIHGIWVVGEASLGRIDEALFSLIYQE